MGCPGMAALREAFGGHRRTVGRRAGFAVRRRVMEKVDRRVKAAGVPTARRPSVASSAGPVAIDPVRVGLVLVALVRGPRRPIESSTGR